MAKRCTCVGLALTTNSDLFLCILVSVVKQRRQQCKTDTSCGYYNYISVFPFVSTNRVFQLESDNMCFNLNCGCLGTQPWTSLKIVTEVVNTVLVPGWVNPWRWCGSVDEGNEVTEVIDIPRGWCMTCMEDNDVEWDGSVIDEVLVEAIETLVTLTWIDYLCL